MAFRQPNGFYFMTPVWGESYTRVFLDIVIPTQLAPGNLPAVHDPERCRYLIFTTARDARVITAAPQFRELSRMMPVEVQLIDAEIKVPHNTMTQCYRRGIRMADEADGASIFLTADLVFSDGSFAMLQQLASKGWRVVHIPGIRLIKAPVAATLCEKFMKEGVISVAPNDLMAIALRNLHPLAYSSLWEEGEGDLIPANLYWRVGSGGILARCFHLHPVLVYPEIKHAVFYGTVDDDYVLASCPSSKQDYISRDSDELLAVELSDLNHHFLFNMQKGSFADAAFWAEMAANSRHRTLIDVPIRLHSEKISEDDWLEAERKSNHVVSEIFSLLRCSSVRLLLRNQRMLERRLVRRAQEKRLQLENHPHKRSLRFQTAASRKRLDVLHYSQVKLSAFRFSLGILQFDSLLGLKLYITRALQKLPIRLFLFMVGMYSKVAHRLARVLVLIRTLIYGEPWKPNPLHLSWIYIRQLSKDVAEILAELNSDILICGDPADSMVARLSANEGVTRFAILHAKSDGLANTFTSRLCDASTGKPLPDASVGSVLVDANLRKYEELQILLTEVFRVLKDGGTMAVKIDRIPNSANRFVNEIFVSLSAASEVIKTKFEVLGSRRQGQAGTSLMMILAVYRRIQIGKLSSYRLTVFILVLVLMPIEIIVGGLLNLLAVLLNNLETTERNYVSSIILAGKPNTTRLSDCRNASPAEERTVALTRNESVRDVSREINVPHTHFGISSKH